MDDLYLKGSRDKIIREYARDHLHFLLQATPPSLLTGPEKGRPEAAEPVWTEETIKACLYLFLAVLCRDQQLIHELADVYVKAGAEVTYLVLPSFTLFNMVLLGFTGFYRFLPIFPSLILFFWVLMGFYLVLPSLRWFYWVLLGFTGFYWFLLGFTEFYLV